MNAQKEIRKAEIQSASGRTVSGYAVRFETESVNMGFVEVIKRGAITDETIKTSDVFALLNHNENTVLARSNHGVGSLTLTVDNDGVYYEFEAPNTANGDELLEHIKRGEISQSSFAFTVSNEDGAETWTKRSDGVIVRQINKIARLYDISPVYQPAYESTTCSKRALEKLSELNKDMEDNKDLHNEADLQEIELLKAIIDEQEQKIKELQEAQTEPEQTEPTDENRADDEDEKKDKEEIENEPSDTQINNTESEPEPTDESTDEDEEKEKNQNNRNISNMEKFSLTKEIRSAIENGTNKIDLRAYTVTDEGTDVVGTDIWTPFEALRAKNVLTDAGARVITGIKNNIQVPVFGATEAKFANETADASDGSGSITSVKLSPKRITARIPISLEMLAQTDSIEPIIRADIEAAVYAAVEDKVFGRQAESTDVYAGIINGVANASITDVSTFSALTNMEATVEAANVDVSKCKYVVSPSGRGKLRAMPKSAKTTELTMQNGEIDGTEVLSTGHLNDVSVNVIYGDWSNVVIGTWDNVQIDTVRDTASLSNGTVNLIVNAFCDVKFTRKNAFAFGKA